MCVVLRSVYSGLEADVSESVPSTMTAAVVHQFGDTLSVEQRRTPQPRRGQALVKVFALGVCHTDLHASAGDWPVKPSPPFVPGHEGVGEVIAVGDDVEDVAVGDLVGNAWLWTACGDCEYCRTGREALCEHQVNGGYTVDGSFGQYMLVDARFAAKLPQGTDPVEVAPVLCAGVTVYRGLKVSETRPGQWMVIVGIGGLGHMAVQYATAMGLRVAAVDVSGDKLGLARELGAEVTINAGQVDPIQQVQEETGGAHGVLVTAVHPSAFEQAIGMARRGATIVFNGLPPGNFPAPIFDIVLRGLTIRGSIVGTRQDLLESIDFYTRGEVRPKVASRRLDEINTILNEMENGQITGRVAIQYGS